MSVLFVLEQRIEPERMEEYVGTYSSMLPDTRAFDGCEQVAVYQNEDDPTDVVLLERWASREQHERYEAWRRDRGDIERLQRLLMEPPRPRYYHTVGI